MSANDLPPATAGYLQVVQPHYRLAIVRVAGPAHTQAQWVPCLHNPEGYVRRFHWRDVEIEVTHSDRGSIWDFMLKWARHMHGALPVSQSVYQPDQGACDPLPGSGPNLSPFIWYAPADNSQAVPAYPGEIPLMSSQGPHAVNDEGPDDAADYPEETPIFEDFLLDSISKRPPAYHVGQMVELFEVDSDAPSMVDDARTVISVVVGVIFDGIAYRYELAYYNEQTGQLEIQMDIDFDEDELTAVGPTVEARYIAHQKTKRRVATLRLV